MPSFRRLPSLIRLAAVAGTALAATAAAQTDCPSLQASRVAQSVQYGVAIACSGVSYTGGGVSVSTTSGCPLFVSIVPQHHEAVASDRRTRVVETGSQPGLVAFFVCRTSYLLFIPWTSSCALDRELVLGAYPQLVTTACRDA